MDKLEAKKIKEFVWEIPSSAKQGMNVPARIFASDKLFKEMDEGVFEQVTNMACLPGIQKYSIALSDAHFGYGAPVGGVAAFDLEEGVISPGINGFDINCGMRLVKTNLTLKDVQPRLKELVNTLFERVPVGVGRKGFVNLKEPEFREMVENGAKWAVENGYGWKTDLEGIESNGCIKGADSQKVSKKAIERGLKQVGTLGSGNHYLEIQVAEKKAIYNEEVAKELGITQPDQILVMVHTGSRGFGHQVATDYLDLFEPAMKKYKIEIKDKQLACVPFRSKEGQDYYAAMACAANYAFVNRQVILHRIREVFSQVFEKTAESLEMGIIYDVAHNIAKIEKHEVEGKKKKVIVHRKGATRSFPPGHEDLSGVYNKIGQPVIVGGSMETGSFLCIGAQKAMEETFGSTMHGSGRTMSRTKAKKIFKSETLRNSLEKKGIFVRAASKAGLVEEAGSAYKNISEVVEAMHDLGISKKVAGLRPIGNIKG